MTHSPSGWNGRHARLKPGTEDATSGPETEPTMTTEGKRKFVPSQLPREDASMNNWKPICPLCRRPVVLWTSFHHEAEADCEHCYQSTFDANKL